MWRKPISGLFLTLGLTAHAIIVQSERTKLTQNTISHENDTLLNQTFRFHPSSPNNPFVVLRKNGNNIDEKLESRILIEAREQNNINDNIFGVCNNFTTNEIQDISFIL